MGNQSVSGDIDKMVPDQMTTEIPIREANRNDERIFTCRWFSTAISRCLQWTENSVFNNPSGLFFRC